jgi:hypothetical protein
VIGAISLSHGQSPATHTVIYVVGATLLLAALLCATIAQLPRPGGDSPVVVSRPVNVASVANVDDGYHTCSFVDPVDHPVGSAARAEPVLQWREQALAYAVWLFK